MKEQIIQLKIVYNMNLQRHRQHKYSLLIICKEQTTFSNRYIAELFEFHISAQAETKAFELLQYNKAFQEFHQKNVYKLEEIGFRFV